MENPIQTQGKSFWNRPEGKGGMIIAILLGGGVLYGLYKLLPYLITLVTNIWILIGLAVPLVLLGYILSSKKTWILLDYMFKSFARWVTGLFVQIDPIGILKSYTETLRNNYQNIVSKIGELKGQLHLLEQTITKNEKITQESMTMAEVASRKGQNSGDEKYKRVFTLNARKAGRLKESNVTLEQMRTKMQALLRFLEKTREMTEILIEDIQFEIETKTQEQKMIKASYSAIKSAMKIINGDQDTKELYDQSMLFLTEDYGKKIGEIENFMDMAKSMIDTMDIQNGMYEEKAMVQFEEWIKNSENSILNNGSKIKAELLTGSCEPVMVPILSENVPAKKYTKYLKN